jgi:hypothetical protein
MSEEKLYKIEELTTTGWESVNELNCNKLTKQLCTQRLNQLLSDGYNPNRLRAVVDI